MWLTCHPSTEAVELAKARAREAEANAVSERAKMTLGLAQLKNRVKGLSNRNTSTVHTPAEVDVSSDSNSSTAAAAAVDGVPSKRTFTRAEVEKLKEYVIAFNSVLSVNGCKLMFHPSPHPTVVKLLSGSGVTTEICPYTPEAVKNAYCALILECESNPDKFLQMHANGELVQDYTRDGIRTPNVLIPR